MNFDFELSSIDCSYKSYSVHIMDWFITTGLELYFFFMLNSGEHEILNAHKYKNIEKFGFFRLS